MRSPRLIYLAVAAVLAVAGFAVANYLGDRSAPGLGDTVVVPAGSSSTPQPSSPGTPTTGPTSGAAPVSPADPRTAGDDDDGGTDDLDDDPGDTDDDD